MSLLQLFSNILIYLVKNLLKTDFHGAKLVPRRSNWILKGNSTMLHMKVCLQVLGSTTEYVKKVA